MRRFLTWTVIRVNRRTFLRRITVATFGLFAGSAVRAPRAFAAVCYNPCQGPNGQGWCGSLLCVGAQCHSNTSYATCTYTSAFCPSGYQCWSVIGKTCCDCYCCTYYNCFYCYCDYPH